MATRLQEYKEKYSEQMIRFNPYAVKKMGLQQSQTMLKLEDYMLICAPYQLSMDRVVLLVILSRDEISFFQQFQNKLTSVNMSFLKPTNKNPINLFIRGTLTRLGPVKGRDNVSLFEVMYKVCPNDLIEIIGDYLLAYESLQGQFDTYKDREVEMNEKVARTMRFNDFVESQIGTQKVQTKLISVGVNRISLEIPGRLPAPAAGQILSSKLYFQTHQFVVNGNVTAVETLGSGAKKVSMELGFTPELVEIMDDYFFRTSFKKE
ncbi:MAG: hypothetical protein JSV89_11585 [Spirochaetaceae bacterium]|nr:MAG: hypothetical protein JSV89_11585 [Spirochaetaceae bacterium]